MTMPWERERWTVDDTLCVEIGFGAFQCLIEENTGPSAARLRDVRRRLVRAS